MMNIREALDELSALRDMREERLIDQATHEQFLKAIVQALKQQLGIKDEQR